MIGNFRSHGGFIIRSWRGCDGTANGWDFSCFQVKVKNPDAPAVRRLELFN
jgi:hypothetical protein